MLFFIFNQTLTQVKTILFYSFASCAIAIVLDSILLPFLTLVRTLPFAVGVIVISITQPCSACSSHKYALVLGAQIALVLGLRHLTPKLCTPSLEHPSIIHFCIIN